MKVRQTSPSDLLADEELVPRFYDLLASVDDEELLEIFHDFMVPANDSPSACVGPNARLINTSGRTKTNPATWAGSVTSD